MKLWQSFLYWLSTSKAERLLLDQVRDLKRDRELLVEQVLRLQAALIPALRVMDKDRERPAMPEIKTAADLVQTHRQRQQEKHRPIVTNWMQSRDRAEYASDVDGERFERAQKAHEEL